MLLSFDIDGITELSQIRERIVRNYEIVSDEGVKKYIIVQIWAKVLYRRTDLLFLTMLLICWTQTDSKNTSHCFQ